ncbi:TetR/AcrR family transcriptional regulator [Caproicibacter sp.]|uniref:TetR/AcrR family transcriptional regulator n=1 Tax=Caproicibacter sp. TaxID=2814884 RepID=UPI0039898573
MENEKQVRKPKQSRSRETKEKILSAAFCLFREKGYYEVTTNEIAKEAGVSIGSLYSYYKDKDSVFLDVLEEYHRAFSETYRSIEREIEEYLDRPKEWVSRFLKAMVRVHREFRQLNLELKALRDVNPQIAARVEKEETTAQAEMLFYFKKYPMTVKTEDPEAAVAVTFHMIDAIVDLVVFDSSMDEERILRAGTEAVYKFLMT